MFLISVHYKASHMVTEMKEKQAAFLQRWGLSIEKKHELNQNDNILEPSISTCKGGLYKSTNDVNK